MITAVNIRQHPASSFGVTGSPKKITEKIRPNTDSKERRMADVFGVKYFCPAVCNRNPIMVLKIPRYRKPVIRLALIIDKSRGPSRTGAKSQPSTALVAIWIVVRRTGLNSSVYRSIKTTCTAKKIPQIKVRKSPRLIEKSPSNDSKARPITAITAAARFLPDGRLWLNSQCRKGTIMTYSVVIKAFLLAVVYFSP